MRPPIGPAGLLSEDLRRRGAEKTGGLMDTHLSCQGNLMVTAARADKVLVLAVGTLQEQKIVSPKGCDMASHTIKVQDRPANSLRRVQDINLGDGRPPRGPEGSLSDDLRCASKRKGFPGSGVGAWCSIHWPRPIRIGKNPGLGECPGTDFRRIDHEETPH